MRFSPQELSNNLKVVKEDIDHFKLENIQRSGENLSDFMVANSHSQTAKLTYLDISDFNKIGGKTFDLLLNLA